jgi:hypothetical protein
MPSLASSGLMVACRPASGVFLVNSLARNAESFRDLRPRPSLGHSARDSSVFDTIRQTPKRTNGGERVGGIVRKGGRCCGHVSTVVDVRAICQPRLRRIALVSHASP